MRITIWDMDWYYKKSFVPNYKAQKISSFHKQQGHIINFIEQEDFLRFDYDIMYIIRDSLRTPMADRKYVDNAKVRLIGNEFKFYDNYYTIPMAVDMVRPDYQLYNVKEDNLYSDANVIQLFSGTTFLGVRQDATNYSMRASQRTLVVDEHMWKSSEKNILLALEELKTHKNIVFLHRINLKKLISNELIMKKFLELNLSVRNNIRFRNDVDPSFESTKKIIDFYVKLKERRYHISLLSLPVKAVTLDHWAARELYFEDLKRCLMIVDYAKSKGIKVILKTALTKNDTPYWYLFDRLEVWTDYYLKMSYVESMLSSRIVRTEESWFEILSNQKKWSTPNSRFLVTLLAKDFEFFKEYGTREWLDKKIDLSAIDKKYIKESVYGKLNEFQIIETLQEEKKE